MRPGRDKASDGAPQYGRVLSCKRTDKLEAELQLAWNLFGDSLQTFRARVSNNRSDSRRLFDKSSLAVARRGHLNDEGRFELSLRRFRD
jgi:hypothetical protein